MPVEQPEITVSAVGQPYDFLLNESETPFKIWLGSQAREFRTAGQAYQALSSGLKSDADKAMLLEGILMCKITQNRGMLKALIDLGDNGVVISAPSASGFPGNDVLNDCWARIRSALKEEYLIGGVSIKEGLDSTTMSKCGLAGAGSRVEEVWETVDLEKTPPQISTAATVKPARDVSAHAPPSSVPPPRVRPASTAPSPSTASSPRVQPAAASTVTVGTPVATSASVSGQPKTLTDSEHIKKIEAELKSDQWECESTPPSASKDVRTFVKTTDATKKFTVHGDNKICSDNNDVDTFAAMLKSFQAIYGNDPTVAPPVIHTKPEMLDNWKKALKQAGYPETSWPQILPAAYPQPAPTPSPTPTPVSTGSTPRP